MENANGSSIRSELLFTPLNLQPLKKSTLSDYIIGKEIGKGAYAIVKECVHKIS
jgi:hypothetical protein